MAGTGGKRPGAGRPKGVSKATLLKRNFQDYFTEKEVKEFIAIAKEQAKHDPIVFKFVLEQIFGKAPQRMVVAGDQDHPIPLLHVLHYDGDNKN